MIPDFDILLDSCVLLNLLSSGRIEEIVDSLDGTIYVCAEVQRESFYIVEDEETTEVIPIDLEPFVTSGLFTQCDIKGHMEAARLMEFSQLLDDGEAHTLSIAICRSYAVATDDKKARKIFRANSESSKLISTSDILRNWAERNSIPDDVLRDVLVNIERKARFTPPSSDSNAKWWNDCARP